MDKHHSSGAAGDEERRAGAHHVVPLLLVVLVVVVVPGAGEARAAGGCGSAVAPLLLHLPHDLHEVVDGAGQLQGPVASREAVLRLGLIQQRPEQRVVGAPGPHREPLLLRAHQHREAPRRHRARHRAMVRRRRWRGAAASARA